MPETIRALIVIVLVGSTILYFAKLFLPNIISPFEFRQWRRLWAISIFASFLSPNYWLFILFLAVLSFPVIKGNNARKFTMYTCLLLMLPMLQKDIPGFGLVNFIFQLDYPRVLSLMVLLPLYLSHSNTRTSFLRLPGDKLLALYLLVSIFVSFRNGSMTNILRSDLYLFLDIFLPYFVASRALKNFDDFKRISLAIFYSVSLIAGVAVIEAIKGWHLYGSLPHTLETIGHVGSNQYRDGLYRTTGPFSSPIVLGYVLVISLGMALSIHSSFRNINRLIPFVSLHIIALITTVSRGPWVGAMILIGLFILLSNNSAKLIGRLTLISIAFSPLIFFTSIGQKIISLLPFIGASNEGSINYRQELLEKSWIVIQRHPLLGSNTYLQTPEMQSMIQGEGIIDIVNSYLRIALNSGLIGLACFSLFFLILVLRLYKALKNLPPNDRDIYLYGISLLSTLVAVLVIIATVSSVDRVSHLYWILAGIITAFLHFLKQRKLNA